MKFYRPIKTDYTIKDSNGIELSAESRGLNDLCDCPKNGIEKSKYHEWLLLPKQKDQKQDLICLKCLKISHT